MLGWLVLAAVATAAPGAPDATFGAWRRCIGQAMRAAAEAGQVPEDLPALLGQACADERARFLADRRGPPPDAARLDAAVADCLRRYAAFYTTGVWPGR